MKVKLKRNWFQRWVLRCKIQVKWKVEKRGRKDESIVESENWLESDVEKQINLKNCWTQHKLIQASKKSVLPKKKGFKVHYSPEFPINGRFTQGGNVLLVQFSGHTAFMMRVHARTLCTLWHIIFHKSIFFPINIQTFAFFINSVLFFEGLVFQRSKWVWDFCAAKILERVW